MAENSTVARPYAEALFASVKGSASDLSGAAEQLELLAQLVQLPDVRAALSDPLLLDEDRIGVVRSLLKEVPFDGAMGNFLGLLVANDRLLLMPEIAHQFLALKDEAEGVAQANIFSAFPLSEEQVNELVRMLEPKFDLKLKPHVTVDETLIGGVRVVVGDYVLDTSVQAQLQRMRDALMA
jgi:F-type H+-transporting ATPase subunit delta